jgi:DNA-binding response OmpR family regulator
MSEERKKILIAEDERPLSRALELKLSHEGYDVRVTGNGQECLDMLEREKFDIVLLDMMMPILDGFQVLQGIQKMGLSMPIFVLSNLSQKEDESQVIGLGARKYFIKSNTPLAILVEEIKQVL